MCIRDSSYTVKATVTKGTPIIAVKPNSAAPEAVSGACAETVSYTHLRAHETVLDLVCRLLLEKKKKLDHNIPIDHTN